MPVAEFDIGFLGGGQLARMSIQAAQRMGLWCLSLDPGQVTPASLIAPALQGELADPEMVAEMFRRCDHVTLENEFIPAEAILQALALAGRDREDLTPTIGSLAIIQDKLLQRQALAEAGVPSPRAIAIEGGLPQMDFPMVLKSRFGGYDGRGTRYARNLAEFDSHRELWQEGGWLAEEFVPFARELATIVYLSDWKTGCFPIMETVQTEHICDLVYPSDAKGSRVALSAVQAVGGKGLYGVEMFQLKNGKILINEIAPRPHNTGHYTLDWGGISQFDQHVRLVMGFPLGDPSGVDTCMANLLGQSDKDDFRSGIAAALKGDSGIFVHWYGKVESRVGRKMGHINAVGENCIDRAIEARNRFYAAANP